MLCKLKLLYRNGVKLTPEELAAAPSYTGNLVVEDWPHGNSFGRFIRLAKLIDTKHPTVNPEFNSPLFKGWVAWRDRNRQEPD